MRFDALIVGAGAAGLQAGRLLQERGLRILVLEARDRIGGRIWTRPDGLELGAEFLHGKPEITWALVKEAKLTACEVQDSHLLFRKGKIEERPGFWQDLQKLMGKLRESRPRDRSFRDFIRSVRASRATKELALSFVEGFDAAHADEISESALARAKEVSGEDEIRVYRLLSGYGGLIRFLAKPLEAAGTLALKAPVSAIRWEERSVTIDSAAGVFTAPRALVTVPLGILQSRAIRFVPDPFSPGFPGSRKALALSYLRSGPVAKIILRFRDRFWEEIPHPPRLGFVHGRGLPFPTWWGALPLHLPILTGWAGGPAAEKLPREIGGWLTPALDSLSALLRISPRELRSRLDDWHAHDWQTDPFARGSYSYVTVGGIHAPDEIARPVGRTLFFAGEATYCDGMGGTVEAALSSGERAAKEMLAASRAGGISPLAKSRAE